MTKSKGRMHTVFFVCTVVLLAVLVNTGTSGYPSNVKAQAQIPDLLIHLNLPEIKEQRIGDTLSLQALHVYRDGHVEKVTRRLQWKSSNKNVATVDRQGVVHFTSDQGTVFLSVSDGRVEDRIELVYREQGRPQVTVIKQKGERYQVIGKSIANMTLEEKVGQMMMPDFRRVQGKNVTTLLPQVAETIKRHQVGGVILFRENVGSTDQTVRLVHEYQQLAQKYGLLVAIDQEGGVVSRLQQGTDLPGNMALGAARSKLLAWKAGDVIGSELASLGINTNFAPDMDVNNNPDNPVIGVRSFGEDPNLVGELGVAYMRGLQQNGVVATVKHFPGHGDTAVDSHLGLPQVPHDLERLAQLELLPFRQAITAGVDAIMTAHVTFPKIDATTVLSQKDGSKIALPATLSPKVITGLIREQLAFDGVIFTDAMNMQAISDHFGPVDASLRAIEAGADILLMPVELDKVIAGIVDAVKKGKISEERINQSVRRILSLKIKRGILIEEDPESIEVKQMKAREVNGSAEHRQVEAEAALRSITLVKNSGVLPLKLTEAQKIAVVGKEYVDQLAEAIQKYHAQTTPVHLGNKGFTPEQWKQVIQADTVILASYTSDVKGRSMEDPLMKEYRRLIEQRVGPVVGVAIRNPYDIMAYPLVDAYLVQYGYRTASFAAMAATLFGGNQPRGRLPVTIPDGKGNVLYPYGHGLSYEQSGSNE
ncbi:glycoside hydrolase family 3 N-terminal domain-containing protein [Brevibacillus centrosporus]|uniref:glycoside hydrolase family 3 N-terminal domain-containing protein n=1 Tax=Brevibacillus centrosporus TaxID=54910 RepID=UPI002E1CDDAE|nr:glycoside hydrolase family 3 N-terminal domain-containing protein [Brevibacillus centrosporus]MED1952847.1 glycoside hydrolase family 3 N-terminal domain-containing protein [Brevibacillus centrosporus]